MLSALIAMYRCTQSIIGSAVLIATIGVRQGSPTSCLLFILFVNELIRMIKENCDVDGFLGWLHILVLMDDTVLLATSRKGMTRKLNILLQFCNEYGMEINQRKTKFFVISGSRDDSQPFEIDNLIVHPCTQYVYLGSIFTSDGSTSSAIAAHARTKMCHVLKFISFLKKNRDIPFYVKRRVFDAALMSSILYGCESWLDADMKPVIKLYNWGIKQLLGVRMSTCNDLCYLEIGYPPLPDLVRQKQRKFFKAKWQEREAMVDDPLMYTILKITSVNNKTSNYIRHLIDDNVDDIFLAQEKLRNNVIQSESSRRITYRHLNFNVDTHEVYRVKKFINDVHRMAFTKFRISGHSLAVETGRWNRRGRGRLPLEERLCGCGAIQTELHVLQSCPMSQHIRVSFGFDSLDQLMTKPSDVVCECIHKLLCIYD